MQLRRPIDIGQPLNSLDGLKYLWRHWTIIGIHPPTDVTKNILWLRLYYIYAAVINLIAAVIFPATLVAYLGFVKSWQELVQNLSLSVTIAVASFKQLGVVIHRQRLLASHEYLKPLDKRCNINKEDRLTILKCIEKCNFFSALYISIYFFCALGFAYIGWANHSLIYSAWYPAIFDNEEWNYKATYIFQICAEIFTVFQNGNNDLYPLCYLTLTIAHFETLAERIKRIGFETESRSIEENIEEFKMCIMDHKHLLR